MSAETPAIVKTAVIAAGLSGKRKSRIARDLGLSKPTVYKILEEAQVDQLANHAKSILYEALPDAAYTIAKAVRKKSADAWELLDRTGAMPKNSDGGASVAVGISLGGMPVIEASQTIRPNQPD